MNDVSVETKWSRFIYTECVWYSDVSTTLRKPAPRALSWTHTPIIGSNNGRSFINYCNLYTHLLADYTNNEHCESYQRMKPVGLLLERKRVLVFPSYPFSCWGLCRSIVGSQLRTFLGILNFTLNYNTNLLCSQQIQIKRFYAGNAF